MDFNTWFDHLKQSVEKSDTVELPFDDGEGGMVDGYAHGKEGEWIMSVSAVVTEVEDERGAVYERVDRSFRISRDRMFQLISEVERLRRLDVQLKAV